MQEQQEKEKKNVVHCKVEDLFEIFEKEEIMKDIVSGLKKITEDFIDDVQENTKDKFD